jgi:hypothetical protein
MNPALKKFSDAALIAELEVRTKIALARPPRASNIDISRFHTWQRNCAIASAKLLQAIEKAGVHP